MDVEELRRFVARMPGGMGHTREREQHEAMRTLALRTFAR
jgi:hypothetical protein